MLNDSLKTRVNIFIASVRNLMGIFGALVILCVIMTIASDKFLTWSNIINVLRTVSLNAIISFGMTFVIINGTIDLSAGSTLSLCGVVCTILVSNYKVALLPAIIISVLTGTLIGLINGLINTKLKIIPFITTLSMQYIVRGLSYIITGGSPVSVNQEAFYKLGNGYLGPIPLPIIYMFVVFIILSFVLYRSKFGRHVYAAGGNELAARFSGINVDRVRIVSFMIIGTLAAFVGIIMCAKLYSGQPTIGQSAEFDAIAAAVLGRVSFTGGIGTLGGSLIGAIVIGVLNNGLNLLGVNSFWQSVSRGLVILTAVYIDSVRNRKAIK